MTENLQPNKITIPGNMLNTMSNGKGGNSCFYMVHVVIHAVFLLEGQEQSGLQRNPIAIECSQAYCAPSVSDVNIASMEDMPKAPTNACVAVAVQVADACHRGAKDATFRQAYWSTVNCYSGDDWQVVRM